MDDGDPPRIPTRVLRMLLRYDERQASRRRRRQAIQLARASRPGVDLNRLYLPTLLHNDLSRLEVGPPHVTRVQNLRPISTRAIRTVAPIRNTLGCTENRDRLRNHGIQNTEWNEEVASLRVRPPDRPAPRYGLNGSSLVQRVQLPNEAREDLQYVAVNDRHRGIRTATRLDSPLMAMQHRTARRANLPSSNGHVPTINNSVMAPPLYLSYFTQSPTPLGSEQESRFSNGHLQNGFPNSHQTIGFSNGYHNNGFSNGYHSNDSSNGHTQSTGGHGNGLGGTGHGNSNGQLNNVPIHRNKGHCVKDK